MTNKRNLIHVGVLCIISLLFASCDKKNDSDSVLQSNPPSDSKVQSVEYNCSLTPEDLSIILGERHINLPVEFSEFSSMCSFENLGAEDTPIQEEFSGAAIDLPQNIDDYTCYTLLMTIDGEEVGACEVITKTDLYEDGVVYNVVLQEPFSLGEIHVGDALEQVEKQYGKSTCRFEAEGGKYNPYVYNSETVAIQLNCETISDTEHKILSIGYKTITEEIFK